ncbi:hypothetical protein BX600DRAFT_391192 [Xylariales sp. PMI_506]|nr:hypothetical protein BX600DRAFT_391192 [Xylariales sp. PMI_506]
MVGCDAWILAYVAKLRQDHEDKRGSWHTLGLVLLKSAAVLTFVAAWTCIDEIFFKWNLILTYVTLRDLVLDSIAVSFGLLAGMFLLGFLESVLVALMVVITTVLVHLQISLFNGTLARAWSSFWSLGLGILIFTGASALVHHAKSRSMGFAPSSDRPFYRSPFYIYGSFAFLVVLFQVHLLQSSTTHPSRLEHLIAISRSHSDGWISGANRSSTISEASQEYTRRYGVPPPPNFDKWYDYATSVDSPIIDDFGQIHEDLLPYWGTLPIVIRERTTHLLQHPDISFGGLIISQGRVDVSPHLRGTHRWMMDVMKTMVDPFAQWLPDMQIAFNLDDECRISVPFDNLRAYKAEGVKSRRRLASHAVFHGFSHSLNPPWPTDYLEESKGEALWARRSQWFSIWTKSPIYENWVALTCSPSSPANTYRWWNRKATCIKCSEHHMVDGVVENFTLSGDLCNQPDLAYLHGFLTSPSAFAASHTLFPVFSQSRMSGFTDILYPSPWHFGDKVAVDDDKHIPWHKKLNSLYWRGSSSDGFAQRGAWQTFLRARFVHLAARLRSLVDSTALLNTVFGGETDRVAVNVSFVGDFSRCDEPDCTHQHTVFYGSPTAKTPSSVNFQEHWHHRHLMDLDGAGFSGRFLSFLRSGSLPYRAALFRTWWEERVHPWRHFVPIDVRLGDLQRVLSYFGGREGDAQAQKIAMDGSEWAKKALRKEDMQVYMFRLLLEWGRIIDDQREELGFVAG